MRSRASRARRLSCGARAAAFVVSPTSKPKLPETVVVVVVVSPTSKPKLPETVVLGACVVYFKTRRKFQ